MKRWKVWTVAASVVLMSAAGVAVANSGDIEMIPVKGGTFTMGCTQEQGNDCDDDDEKPAHNVTVGDFYIGKYEVTQTEWVAVMGENPSRFKGDNLPVENVSWDDVQVFISKLNSATGKRYRLPTEAEWEYAARGGRNSKGFKYAGGNDIGNVAWYDGNSNGKTHPVGTKKANELGIHDMSGNVWEWVGDWWSDNYAGRGGETDPTGPASGSYRVIRGGGWGIDARYARVSIRTGYGPDGRYINIGFRLVLPSSP